MRTLATFLVCCAAQGTYAQVTHQLIASDFQFDPPMLIIDAGDSIHLVFLETDHNCTEVNESTWNANGSTYNGGFQFGFGTSNPGSEVTFSLDQPDTNYYVCTTHIDMGMKGKIIVLPSSAGIGEADPGVDLLLLPNPATEHVRLVIPASSPQVFVSVHDALGREVLATDMRGTTDLDLQGLRPGTYLVKATDDRGVPIASGQLQVMR